VTLCRDGASPRRQSQRKAHEREKPKRSLGFPISQMRKSVAGKTREIQFQLRGGNRRFGPVVALWLRAAALCQAECHPCGSSLFLNAGREARCTGFSPMGDRLSRLRRKYDTVEFDLSTKKKDQPLPIWVMVWLTAMPALLPACATRSWSATGAAEPRG